MLGLQGSCLSLSKACPSLSALPYSLEEGRAPWKALPALPLDHMEAETGVTAVAADESAIFAGLDNGVVVAWDCRGQQDMWQVRMGPDFDQG